MTTSLRSFALIVCTASVLPNMARASGSYPPNPPRLGGLALAQIDARTYNLGKTVFLDRLSVPSSERPSAEAEANRVRLASVQALLPERVRAEVDLPALANRLDRDQLDALLYYVGIRFRVTIPAAA